MAEEHTKRALFRRIARWSLLALAVFAVWFWLLPHEGDSVERMREAVLKSDLHQMRKAIENFTADKKRAPRSLQELLEEKYLRSIPVDPMTGKRDWRISDPIFDPVRLVAISVDVHSASERKAVDGSKYRQW